VVIIPSRALLVETLDPGGGGSMKKLKPVHRRVMAKNGKVTNKRLRRPKVSIVKKAGRAKTQFRIPVPMEASRAGVLP